MRRKASFTSALEVKWMGSIICCSPSRVKKSTLQVLICVVNHKERSMCWKYIIRSRNSRIFRPWAGWYARMLRDNRALGLPYQKDGIVRWRSVWVQWIAKTSRFEGHYDQGLFVAAVHHRGIHIFKILKGFVLPDTGVRAHQSHHVIYNAGPWNCLVGTKILESWRTYFAEGHSYGCKPAHPGSLVWHPWRGPHYWAVESLAICILERTRLLLLDMKPGGRICTKLQRRLSWKIANKRTEMEWKRRPPKWKGKCWERGKEKKSITYQIFLFI